MRGRAIFASMGTAVLALLAGRAEAVESVALAGRIGRDVGTLFVSGTESGTGGGVGLRFSFGDADARWEPEIDMDVAGYKGQGDGDPVVQASLMLSRRAFLGRGTDARPWWSLGAGAGWARIAGAATIFPVRLALGLSIAPQSSVGLEASLFNRFTLATGSGDPGTEYINTAGVEVAVRFGK
jgi:hypothetical protein